MPRIVCCPKLYILVSFVIECKWATERISRTRLGSFIAADDPSQPH